MSQSPLDPDARTLAADLFEQFAPLLVRRLARARPGTDRQLLCDACVQAILQLSQAPARYQQWRGSFLALLLGAARRVLSSLLRADRRRRCREQKKAINPVTAEAPAERSSLAEQERRELADQARAAVARTDEERRALDLWLRGESDPAVYAQALGWTGLLPAEQEARLRQLLARLRQRLHRYRERLRKKEAES
jgi:hypothetical protein